VVSEEANSFGTIGAAAFAWFMRDRDMSICNAELRDVRSDLSLDRDTSRQRVWFALMSPIMEASFRARSTFRARRSQKRVLLSAGQMHE